MGRSRWIAAVSLAAIFAGTSPRAVRAHDPERTAAARALFEEGVSFAERGNWSEAADRFERTYAIRPSPNVLYNLASARVELGQLVVGSELLRRIVEDEATPAALRRAAEQRLTAVSPRIARLRIAARDLARGDEVRLDGRSLDRVLLGVDVPVDPGSHRVAVVRRGRSVAFGEARVSDGETVEIALEVPPAIDPTHAAEASEAPALARAVSGNPNGAPSLDEGGRPLRKQWWFWTALTAVVAAGAVTAWLLLRPTDEDGVVQGDFSPGVIEL